MNLLPDYVAAEYNAAFNPPAINLAKYGGYTVVCSAQVPYFEVVIGGETFAIDANDQLIPLAVRDEKGEDLCFSGTQNGDIVGGGKVYVL